MFKFLNYICQFSNVQYFNDIILYKCIPTYVRNTIKVNLVIIFFLLQESTEKKSS